MDKLKNNNKEHAVIASIECPYNNAADADVDVESNKSTPTPYFTPLDFLQTSFEFPSPTTTATGSGAGDGDASVTDATTAAVDEDAQYTPKQFTIANPKQQQQSTHQPLPQSPTTLNRKFKRFSLYDRRSCSPQQDGRIFANKENTVPKKCNSTDNEHDSRYLSKSEHNSPTILFRDDSSTITTTPNLNLNTNLLNDSSSRLSYSPKLLTSINNLNLNQSLSGSPLSIINSAGYKNGNFFRFPEIDHVVQVQDVAMPAPVPTATSAADEEPDNQATEVLIEQKQDEEEAVRRNRKNKNNLTIRITDVQLPTSSLSSSLARPKTPTIKSTKEKARSLDSAANETELSVIVVQHTNESHDMTTSHHLHHHHHTNQSHLLMQPAPSSLHSTSLSRLDTNAHQQQHQLQQHQSLHSRRTTRHQRKSPGLNNSDWMMYHRKQNPYQSSLDADELKSASSVDSSSAKFTLGANLAPRSAHKLNPLLHSSSTNLKTLPECLTLVEFTPSTSSAAVTTTAVMAAESPFKQKSMDLPTKSMAGSMNLLQRRGSNHSLTLNLHSSCGNLMNSGLSVSNYSLGTVSNSKSSCNLEQQQLQQQQQQQQQQQLTVAAGSAQCTRQGLFRRRGSNHSITLKNHTTNSCGELNAMATTPKRGLLERRGSNQSLTLNMGGAGAAGSAAAAAAGCQQLEQQSKLTVCSCGAAASASAAASAAQAAHQRKFFSTENLKSNSSQFLDFGSSKQPLCFGSASDLQPSEPSELLLNKSTAGHMEPGVVLCSCSCSTAAGVAGGIRNIMTRPLSPQTTSEEFKIYLASIQMLQSASNPLNQYDLIKLNYVFDHSYKANLEQPPVLVLGRDGGGGGGSGGTPTSQLPPTSEDSELLAMYQAVVERICSSNLPQLDGDEQKRIFRDLHKEFWDLPLNHQEKPMVFGSQTKNRYKTILPNEHSRVLLASEATELFDLQQQHQQQSSLLPTPATLEKTMTTATTLLANEDLPYINANYIKGPDYVSKCYVASQGPLPNTIFEFWLMVFQNTQRYIRRCLDGGGGSSSSPHVDKSHILQQYYQKIVMLTNFTECGRQKCAVYFPIELNELFAVAAKGEVFQLNPLARDYFEPYLLPNASSKWQGESLLERDRDRYHIVVDSLKVTVSEQLRRTLPTTGSFFLIKNVGIVRRNGYSVRKLMLLYCLNVPECGSAALGLEYYVQKICCYHYWYPDWPDHHSPRDINTLLDTCLHLLNLGKCESEFDHHYDDGDGCAADAHLSAQRLEIYKQDIFNAVQPLPIIHCSAGIGRTGCFTAIMNAVRQLRQSLAYSLTGMLSRTLTQADLREEELRRANAADADTESSFSCNTILHIRHIVAQTECIGFDKLPRMPDIFVDILGIVCNLRLQRGGMVQNSEQYELIHRAICLYLKRTLALRRF